MLVADVFSVARNRVSHERELDMATPKHQFVVDDSGKRKAVILDIAECRKLIEGAEELEAIRAYDAAKAAGDDAVAFEQAISEMSIGSF